MQSAVPEPPSAVPPQLQCLALTLSKHRCGLKARSLSNHPDEKILRGELFLRFNPSFVLARTLGLSSAIAPCSL